MKQKLFVFIILSLVLINFSQAQDWNQRKYEFQYGVGITNFMGDIAAPSDPSKVAWIHLFKTVSPIANVGLRYNLKDRHYVSGHLYFGQMYAEDPLGNPNFYYRGLRFNSFFSEISAKYEFLIFEEKSRQTIYKQLGESRIKNFNLPTYIFIGFGSIVNVGSLISRNDLNVNKDPYVNFSPVIPIGIGVKYRIDRYTYLNVEIGTRLALNDGIDNAKGKEDKTYGEFIDQYQFLTLNLIHKLRSNKNGLPKFRKR